MAKIPLALGLWAVCGVPVTGTWMYLCACGHEREGSTCGEHAPRPGEVGCSLCWEQGHDCPMVTWPPGGPRPAGFRCPLCSQPPYQVLAGGGQCFCETPGCKVVIWDATRTVDENLTNVNFIDLSGWSKG